ncbi:hypothetical protein [Streptomyces albogriseolus]|uniref:hypothetical protein n=1 Tax=Streptomyces albogriseolus TaxID=1887 RepID=UPI003F49F9F5
MDEDDARTDRVGIPASYGHYLLWTAVTKPYGDWDTEWVRLVKTQSRQAAKEWADRLETQFSRLIELVYPGGATAGSRSSAEVRSLAEALAQVVSMGGAR